MNSSLTFALCLVRCLLRERQYKEARWLMDCVWLELTGEAPPLNLFPEWMPEWYGEIVAATFYAVWMRQADVITLPNVKRYA